MVKSQWCNKWIKTPCVTLQGFLIGSASSGRNKEVGLFLNILLTVSLLTRYAAMVLISIQP
jgi:hypothetical protein